MTGIFSVAGGTVCQVGTVGWEQFNCEQFRGALIGAIIRIGNYAGLEKEVTAGKYFAIVYKSVVILR